MLAIIPARGGSKGLPHKNIRMLNGKPLIAYSIEAALNCSFIDRVVVSTESEKIAEVAIEFGAEVPRLRPPELAGDKASLGMVIANMLNVLSMNKVPTHQHVVLLPTSPFRSKGLMEHLCALLASGHEKVHTARQIVPGHRFLRKANSTIQPLPSISSAPCLRPYGIFGGVNAQGGNPPYVHEVKNPLMLLDIDIQKEFEIAEQILKNGAFDFNGTFTQ